MGTGPALAASGPRLAFGALLVASAFVAIVTVALGVAAVAGVFRGESATLDFSAFYTAGQLIREGREGDLYDIELQEETQRRVSEGNYDEPLPFALPAFVAFLFVPLAFLPLRVAYGLMLAANLGMLAALLIAMGRILRSVPLPPRRALLAATALSIPAVAVVTSGQLDLIVALALVGGYLLSERGRPVEAGLVLAAAFVKPQLALGVLLMLLVTGDRRALGTMLASGFALALLPVLAMGTEAVAGNIGALESVGRPALMSNWRGFLVSAGVGDSFAVWGPGWLLITLAVLASAVRVWRGGAGPEQRWAVAFLLPLAVSPHLHGQSLVLVLPAAALALRAWTPRVSSGEGLAVTAAFGLYVALFLRWAVGLGGVSLGVFLLLGIYALAASSVWPRRRQTVGATHLTGRSAA